MHRSPPHSILQLPHNDLSKMVQRLCRIPCILTDSDGMCVCRPQFTPVLLLCALSIQMVCASTEPPLLVLCAFQMVCAMCTEHVSALRGQQLLWALSISSTTPAAHASHAFSVLLTMWTQVRTLGHVRMLTNAFLFVYGKFYARKRALSFLWTLCHFSVCGHEHLPLIRHIFMHADT